MRVRRSFDFEAAHRLPRHPGKCHDLHGHSYRLVVTVDRPVDPESGIAMDFADLKAVVRRAVVDVLDHRFVNDVIENPTAEVLCERGHDLTVETSDISADATSGHAHWVATYTYTATGRRVAAW